MTADKQQNNTTLIGSIQKFSTEDGPGIRTTVFLKGCPLNCAWCHNPEMISYDQQMIISPSRCIGCMECTKVCPEGGITVGPDGPGIDFSACRACGHCAEVCFAKAITPVAQNLSASEVMRQVLQDKDFYESTGGGVTLSGGEPLSHFDFAMEMIAACREEGINVCIDSCGQGRADHLLALASEPNVEHILFDVKHMDPERHLELTGVSNEHILSNLKMLADDPKLRDKIWIRMPLIKDLNDDLDLAHRTAGFLSGLGLKKVSLLGYHELGVSKAKNTGAEFNKFETPTDERMHEIKSIMENAGLKADFGGRQ